MTSLKIRSLKTLFVIYWVLLAYVIAALVWWFISLERQNIVLTDFKQREINDGRINYYQLRDKINEEKKTRTAQYIGEGATFLVLIIAGAVVLFRGVRRELKLSKQQQNFMMAVTHELKTPIAITRLNLETLQKRQLASDVQQKLIGNTLEEANRLNDLCNNLLLTGQFEAGRYNLTKENIDLSEIVIESVREYKRRFPERIIKEDIQSDIYIIADRLLLQMAINNLIDNAIKYSPADKFVTVELSKRDSNIVLSVKDEGKGISNSEKLMVFEKFYRSGNESTKKSKGTGLGLYLTKAIVKQHKGNITVLDNSPSGSIFEITFKTNG